MDTPATFRQNSYTITKRTIRRKEEHSEETNRMTEHITNLISVIALLNNEINITVHNIVYVHLYKLDDLRLKQD